jgi:hypothetical protein
LRVRGAMQFYPIVTLYLTGYSGTISIIPSTMTRFVIYRRGEFLLLRLLSKYSKRVNRNVHSSLLRTCDIAVTLQVRAVAITFEVLMHECNYALIAVFIYPN